jgi:hypothetical protein
MALSNFSYSPAVNARLERLLSLPRLLPYKNEVGGSLQAALDLYVWNVGAASALYGPLQVLEVIFRNAMDREMRALYGATWPFDPAFGTFLNGIRTRARRASGYKPPDLRKGIATARAHLSRSFRVANPSAPLPRFSVDDLVAATTFGYWTTMLDAAFEPGLWARGLKNAFPHYSAVSGGTFSRSPVAARFNDLRALRNRVMHHEPLFKRASLVTDYEHIVEACAWIDLDASAWIDHHARFKSVLDLRERPRHVF